MNKKLKEVFKKIQSNERMVLYNDSVNGKQTFRDDLWAISTEELKQVESIFASYTEELKKKIEEVHTDLHNGKIEDAYKKACSLLSKLNQQQ